MQPAELHSSEICALSGKNQLLSSTLFHAKAQSPQRKTKINFFKNLGVFAPLRENLI